MNTQYEQLRSMAEDALAHCLPAGEPYAKVLTESAAYSLMAGGKRIRPILVLEFCRVCGGTVEKALSRTDIERFKKSLEEPAQDNESLPSSDNEFTSKYL